MMKKLLGLVVLAVLAGNSDSLGCSTTSFQPYTPLARQVLVQDNPTQPRIDFEKLRHELYLPESKKLDYAAGLCFSELTK